MSDEHEMRVEPVPREVRFKFSAFVCIAVVVLFGLTVCLYWPACANGFVRWDDNFYVYEQPRILQGISLDGIRWASSAVVCGHWHPLTLISLQLDAHLFGKSPMGFHRTAVLLHALNSVLAFFCVLMLTGCRWRSIICGFLFAFHPMRVESVAWISERKDVLSGTFFFLSVIGYIWYVRSPSVTRYLLVMASLLLGLLAKSMLVTTPCLLLLLDFWPLGRVQFSAVGNWHKLWHLIREKLPLFGLSFSASLVNLMSQQGAMSSLNQMPLDFRLQNAIASYGSYLSQSVWPVSLSPLYTLQEISWTRLCTGVAVLVAFTAITIWQRNQQPYLLVGWLWFLGILAPVIGLFQVGDQARADRYMYLSQLGLYLAIVWWVTNLVERSKFGKIVAMVITIGFIAGFGYATAEQIPVWRDTESMWKQVRCADPTAILPSYHLTKYYIGEGKHNDAIAVANDAICISNPTQITTLLLFARLLADNGEMSTSVAVLNKALEFYPEKVDLLIHRGKALAALEQWSKAAEDYRIAEKLSPTTASYQFFLAHALAKTGNQQESNEIYKRAVLKSPQWPQDAARAAWKMSTDPNSTARVTWPVQLAEQANEATGKTNPLFLDVLAASYANSGRFDDAVLTINLAIQIAEKDHQTGFAITARNRRDLYQSQKPYREQP